MSFHGYPRFTHDIDVVVIPEFENALSLLGALQDFGFGSVSLTAEDFTRPVTVALGRAPHQIDIMTYIKGVEIGEAWERRVQGLLDGVVVSLISKRDLIANKRAVGRPEDLADIARLEDEP